MTDATIPGPDLPQEPRVLLWFKVYTGFMTGLYVLCLLAGPVVMYAASRVPTDEKAVLMIQGAVLMAVGLPLAVAFALPYFLPRKRWVWVYNLVLICIGLTSCCILPAAVLLLIHWIKPQTKGWFGGT